MWTSKCKVYTQAFHTTMNLLASHIMGQFVLYVLCARALKSRALQLAAYAMVHRSQTSTNQHWSLCILYAYTATTVKQSYIATASVLHIVEWTHCTGPGNAMSLKGLSNTGPSPTGWASSRLWLLTKQRIECKNSECHDEHPVLLEEGFLLFGLLAARNL